MKEDINLNISNKIFPFFTQFESSLEKKEEKYYFNIAAWDNTYLLNDLIFLYNSTENQLSEDIKNNIKKDIDNEKFILHIFEKDLTNEESKKYITLLSAISLVKRIRNTHAHEKESNANIDLVEENGIKYLKYKNTKKDSIIDCKIPVSYVNEFGKSITPLEEHIEFKRESIYYVNNINK